MNKVAFVSGTEARKNFETAMKSIFKAPKTVAAKAAKNSYSSGRKKTQKSDKVKE